MKKRQEILDQINEATSRPPGVPISDRNMGYIAALYWVLGNID